MKKGNWWVKEGVLTSSLDPTSEMSLAANAFPSEYVPMVFMTGDGHRRPPFKWTCHEHWLSFFDALVAANEICCHVEKYSDAVESEDVPANLQKVFMNNKVFGWEPEIFKDLEKIQNECFRMMGEDKISISEVRILTNSMRRVTLSNYLEDESNIASEFYLNAIALRSEYFSLSALKGYENFIGKYAGTSVMKLRTLIHAEVGSTIEGHMKLLPDHMHIVTCGDAHISCSDPLYDHVAPPIGTFGIADRSQGTAR